MTDTIHCPRCGSHNVECQDKPHVHRCHDCGYDGTTPPRAAGWTADNGRLSSDGHPIHDIGLSVDGAIEAATPNQIAALVADVRAARLADDMAAVIRRLMTRWTPYVRPGANGDIGTWEHPLEGEEPMSPGEVAALHHARQQEPTHTRTSTGGYGPDFCAECSAANQEWAQWPCDHARQQDQP